MLQEMKLRGRILLGYLVPLLLSIVMVMVVYVNVKTLENLLIEDAETHTISDHVTRLNFAEVRREKAVRDYLLSPNETSAKTASSSMQIADESILALTKLLKDEVKIAVLQKIVERDKELDDSSQSLIKLVDEGKQAAAVESFKKSDDLKISRELEGLSEDLAKMIKKDWELIRQKRKDGLGSIKLSALLGSALSIITAALIGLWLASRISAPITKMAGEISATSSQISATLTQHERTASNQSAMVSETATTVEELGASSRITAQQAETAAETARKAGAMTAEGKNVMEQAATAMDGLKDKVGEIAAQILRLAEQTTRINSIASLVKDLAGEINMLALNASVECVRGALMAKRGDVFTLDGRAAMLYEGRPISVA